MTESELQRQIMLAVSATGTRLFRNNVGQWEYAPGKFIRYGLCVGSSDLIGYTNTGRFVALEIKVGKAKPTAEQTAFLEAVQSCGGIAACVRSVEEALEALR